MPHYAANSPSKWGDTASILISGLTSYLPRRKGRIRLIRTGPFVPQISIGIMGQVIVTENQVEWLRSIPGVLGFLPIIQEKIVRNDWDGDSDPVGNSRMLRDEPEAFLIHGEHDPAVAKAIGALYELLLADDGEIIDGFDACGNREARFEVSPSKNLSLFNALTPGGYHAPIFSERFIQQCEASTLKWIELTEIR